MTKVAKFWQMVGGRKFGNGAILAALLTVMAFPLHATFTEYATFLATALLGTSGLIAAEDVRRANAPAEPPPPTAPA